MKTISRATIDSYPRRYRASLINCLSGPKAPVLIGTEGQYGRNLALFNSVFHVGANPALIGMVSRPHTVTRHTLEHILETKAWTINHIHGDILAQAHQTSAKYEQSEFEAVGLSAEYSHGAKVPYVAQSRCKILCSYVSHYPIKENGTIIIVGSIDEVVLAEESINEHGEVLFGSDHLCSIGLNNYYSIEYLSRKEYAKV